MLPVKRSARHALPTLAAAALAFLAATASGAADPAPQATPSPSPRSYTRYLALDLDLVPRVANAVVPAHTVGRVSGGIRGAFAYHLLGNRFAEIESHDWRYAPPASVDARPSDAGTFDERQTTLRTGVIGTHGTFLAFSNLVRTNTYGAPRLTGLLGIGVEALPNFDRPATRSASVFYYSDVHGTLASANGPLGLSYKVVTYELSAALTKPGRPLFLEIGIIGDHYIAKAYASVGESHRAIRLGFGIHR